MLIPTGSQPGFPQAGSGVLVLCLPITPDALANKSLIRGPCPHWTVNSRKAWAVHCDTPRAQHEGRKKRRACREGGKKEI